VGGPKAISSIRGEGKPMEMGRQRGGMKTKSNIIKVSLWGTWRKEKRKKRSVVGKVFWLQTRIGQKKKKTVWKIWAGHKGGGGDARGREGRRGLDGKKKGKRGGANVIQKNVKPKT